MPKWIFEDDCLAPRGRVTTEYNGPNPYDAIKKVTRILRTIFEAGSKDVWERDFRWDITSDPRSFYIRIYTNRAIDARSRWFVETTFEGKQPSDLRREGSVKISIGARLITEFNRQTFFQKMPIYKALLILYRRTFYDEIRRNYIKICRERLDKISNELRSVLNIAEIK